MSTTSPSKSHPCTTSPSKYQQTMYINETKLSGRPDLIPLIFDDVDEELKQDMSPSPSSLDTKDIGMRMDEDDKEAWLETQYSLLHAMDTHDLTNLRTFGIQAGFQTSALRKKIWPLLLKLDFNVHKEKRKGNPPPTPSTKESNPASSISTTKSSKMSPHSLSPNRHTHPIPFTNPYSEQIALDIKRCFTQFQSLLNPTTKSRKQKQLELILNQLFSTYPSLHYYQGWHDIGAVFLLLLNDIEITRQALERVAIYYLRDAMHTSLEPIMFQMLILLPILKREHRSLYQLFEQTQLHPYFCLSWIITWFAHDLKDFDVVCRIFDFCLCTSPSLPIYMSTALVLMHSDAILEQEPDYAFLHHFLSNLPSHTDTFSLHLEEWLSLSLQLYKRYPVSTLKALTGWTFDSESASFRFDQDFLSSDPPALASNAILEPVMQSKVVFPKDTPYLFKPLALIRRVGKTYVFVDGDATKLLVIAMAVGLIGITLSSPRSSSITGYFTDSAMNLSPSTLILNQEGEELWTHITTFVKNMVLSLIFR